MGLEEKLKKINRVALDTAPFIYFFEKNQNYLNKLRLLFDLIDNSKIEAYTSVITLIESVILPLRKGQKEIAEKYEDYLLNSSNLTTFEITLEIAKKAAELRAKYNIRTPDAIQAAVGIINQVELFITNDKNLKKVKEIEVVTLEDEETETPRI